MHEKPAADLAAFLVHQRRVLLTLDTLHRC